MYHTIEDTCIFETPVMWGSDMHIDLSVYLKVGPVRLVVPVQVSLVATLHHMTRPQACKTCLLAHVPMTTAQC